MSFEVTGPPAPNNSSFTDRTIESLVDLDTVLGSLSHRRRREVLSLIDEQSVWTVDELAGRIVDENLTGQSKPEIEVGLCHNYLPKLTEAELIRYDQQVGVVQPGECFEAVRAMMDAASDVMNTQASKSL